MAEMRKQLTRELLEEGGDALFRHMVEDDDGTTLEVRVEEARLKGPRNV